MGMVSAIFCTFRIYGYGFLNSLIGKLFWHFWMRVHDFQKMFWIYGYNFEKFIRV